MSGHVDTHGAVASMLDLIRILVVRFPAPYSRMGSYIRLAAMKNAKHQHTLVLLMAALMLLFSDSNLIIAYTN